ncbi:MAG: site-specific integrase [bacterium]|nr:site-specific integrase [bacterium]
MIWDHVDLERSFIRLSGKKTKSGEGRVLKLHPRVAQMLAELLRVKGEDRVFLKDGQPFDEFKHAYTTAVKVAGLGDFTFHDLRHCAINNMRLAGNDYFKIMAQSGHKTTSVFKRYNLVTEEELNDTKRL